MLLLRVKIREHVASQRETHQFGPPTVDSHRYNYSKSKEVPNLNQEPVTNPLLDHIPDIFYRYIKRLDNVKGDGNCGFRSIAVNIGLDENMWPLIRQELLQELRYHKQDYTDIWTPIGFNYIWNTVNFSGTGFATMDKWMFMPDTGLVIASFYRRSVVYISMVKMMYLVLRAFRFGLVHMS
ncbi:probable terpene synthase 6 [Tanacetum coccineum]